MPVQHAPDALWHQRLRAIGRLWAAAEQGDPEGIHQLRVASRRVQEALPLASGGHHRRRVRRARRKVRALRQALGAVRERDVTLGLLATIEASHPDARSAVHLVRQAIRAERQAALREAAAYLSARSPADLTRKLSRAADGASDADEGGARAGRTDGTDWRLRLAAGVARRVRQLEQAIEHAGGLYAADRLHRVRVSAKKLRYALELGHEVRLRRWGAAIRSLKQIQDHLGALQDGEVLMRHIRSVSSSSDVSTGQEAFARLTRLLEEDTRQHHARFLRLRARLLTLCATVRRQASEVLPVGRPIPRSLSGADRAAVDARVEMPAASSHRTSRR